MSRFGLIVKIENCIRLAASDNESESAAAIEKARDLCIQYEVHGSEISADLRMQMLLYEISVQLSIIKACLTREARFVGGERGRWLVTGYGEVSADDMIAIAASMGVRSRYDDFTRLTA